MHSVQALRLGLAHASFQVQHNIGTIPDKFAFLISFILVKRDTANPASRPARHASNRHIFFYVPVSNQVNRHAICIHTYTYALAHTFLYSLDPTLPHIYTLPMIMAVVVLRRLNADATPDAQRSLLPHAPHHLIYNQHTCIARSSMSLHARATRL